MTRGTEKIKGFDFPSDFARRKEKIKNLDFPRRFCPREGEDKGLDCPGDFARGKEKIILAETGWSGVVIFRIPGRILDEPENEAE